MQTRAGGVGAARCLTIFTSHLNSRHGRDGGQPTTEDDFCQPPSSLTQTWRSGTRTEGRRPRRRPTAWAPADRGQPSHCHLRMASPRRRRSARSLGNSAVPWRPTGRRAARGAERHGGDLRDAVHPLSRLRVPWPAQTGPSSYLADGLSLDPDFGTFLVLTP